MSCLHINIYIYIYIYIYICAIWHSPLPPSSSLSLPSPPLPSHLALLKGNLPLSHVPHANPYSFTYSPTSPTRLKRTGMPPRRPPSSAHPVSLPCACLCCSLKRLCLKKRVVVVIVPTGELGSCDEHLQQLHATRLQPAHALLGIL